MVGCLSENTIQGLVAGSLTGEAHVRAQRHIETCAECRTLVIELARDGDEESTGTLATLPANVTSSPATRDLADRFELLRPLGRGGMGVVYEALDRARGARVALKTLQHVSADGLLRFKTEFRALQDVQHPNLVTFGELIEDHGQWWLTMELVDGVAFLDHVRPGGRLDERRLRAALPQLAAALSALHAHGLVHRDVKPHNVLVTPAERVVLLDFGLVASVAQSESNVVGTPAYMAPEQGLLEEVGPAADWYSVGALLYEALTGALPFQGAPLQVLIAKQHELPRRPGELASVPSDLEELCVQLLAVVPSARLAAAAALVGLDPGAALAPPALAAPAFVGRQRELASLAGAFADTRAGSEAIVLVQGESGIGKSALAAEFLRGVRDREPEILVLAGRCYERETVPYKGIDGVVDTLARHLRKLSAADAAAVLPRRAGLLVQAFPVLGKIPALHRLPADDVLDPVELRTRAFAALRELFGRLAERGPLVVWIDDLQWADADSLELLAWVMAPPEAPPLLLLLTSRPPREATGSSSEAAMARVRAMVRVRLIELSPLAREEAVALAERLLADHPAALPGRAALVADEAAGHPLFIDALVRHPAVRSADHLPLRLSDALWARIAELDPPARQLLALVAVAGWPLSPEILTGAAMLPAEEIDPALARLRQAHLTRVADRTGKHAVEPYHDRVREAVLDHLDPDLRKECHRALARALLAVAADRDPTRDPHEPVAAAVARSPSSPSSSDVSWGPEAVAVHLHAAGDLEQAARYMVLAADRAAAALAFDRAARLYRQALALHAQPGSAPEPSVATRDVRVRLARVLVNAGRGAEAAAIYFDLAREAEAAGEEDLELRLRGAEQLLCSGHQEEGRRTLAGVLDELDLRPAATRAGALLRLVWRRAWMRLHGLGVAARGHLAGKTEPPQRERLRLEACRVAWMTTELPLEYFTRYQVLAVRAGDPRCVGLALHLEVYVAALTSGGRARRVARLLDAFAAAAERSADPFVLGQEQNIRALIWLMRGQWARAREHGARAVQLFRERCLGASYEIAIAEVNHSLALFYLGELRDFVRAQQPLWRGAEERGDHFTLVMLHNTASVASLIEDQPLAARQQVDRAMAVWTAVEADVRILAGQITLAAIDLYEGDGVAAYRQINHDWRRKMVVPLVRLPYMRAVMHSLRALAAVMACRSGDLDRRLLRAATRDARSLRSMGMPWTDAMARIVEAGVALATGARAEARAQLERAHAEFSAAGMNLHAALAQRRLGELTGGAEGARMIAKADAWLAAQGVRAPERLARLFVPNVT